MQTKYRTSRQSRRGLENIAPRRTRQAAGVVYGPCWPLWNVSVASDISGYLVAATSAAMAVALVRPRLRNGAELALVASPAVR
jgi:hypothetical protein